MHSFVASGPASSSPLAFLTKNAIILCGFVAILSPAEAEDKPEVQRQRRNPVVGAVQATAPEKKAPEAKPVALPPLPEGVTQLHFSYFFKTPIGPRGLEITDELLALNGKRVRIIGYMVHEDLSRCNSCVPAPGAKLLPAWMEATVPGRMMLTPIPVMVSQAHYGLADDLPPQTLYVTVPDKFGQLVPYTPGLLMLTGTLSVGNKREPDGRVSVARLELELPESANPQMTENSVGRNNHNPTQAHP